MKNKEKQELPSWFDGEVYEIIQMGVAMDIDRCYDIMQKGGDWILANNPSAYMTLID